jgi:hypothetical protein
MTALNRESTIEIEVLTRVRPGRRLEDCVSSCMKSRPRDPDQRVENLNLKSYPATPESMEEIFGID